jgi:hypothetical protein
VSCDDEQLSIAVSKDGKHTLCVKGDKDDWTWKVLKNKTLFFQSKTCASGRATSEDGAKVKAEFELEKLTR